MQTQEPTDAELVRAAAAGAGQAFATLYARHRPSVFAFVLRLARDGHLAEDITQEAFVTALRNLADLREPERFRPWLVSIAHRAALDHLRKPGPALMPELPELVAGEASPPRPPPRTRRPGWSGTPRPAWSRGSSRCWS